MSQFQKKTSYRRRLQEHIDYDYVQKLSPEDQAWLDRFTKTEYANDRPRKQQSDQFVKENYVHSKEDIKRLDDANNARNRDLYSRAKVTRNLSDITPFEEELTQDAKEDDQIDFNTVSEVYNMEGYNRAVEHLYGLVIHQVQTNHSDSNIRHALCRFHVEIKRLERLQKKSKKRD